MITAIKYFRSAISKPEMGARNCVRILHLLFAFLVFILCSARLNAQQVAPVLANLQIAPPFTAYLTDYVAPGSNKLQVNLFLKDLTKTNYACRLRIKIEGFGLTIQSKNDFNTPALFINGGELSVFSGSDLEAYFNPQNLVFNGLNQSEFSRNGGKLPEGVYRFKVEVIDYYRKNLVSNSAVSVASIFLAYPPIINQPFNLSKVTAMDPQNVIFQWTPRSTGSINSAYQIAYKFRLAEIIPADRDPNDAIRTSRPIYETFTDQTLLVYGIAEPALNPGSNYAVQVQAIDAEGRDLFINNGNSEVVKFTYGEKCAPPANVMAELSGYDAIKVSWNTLPLQQAFTIRYREADKPNAAWFEKEVYTPEYLIQGLRSSTTYEYQVKAQCIFGYGDYSELQSFNVPDEALTQGDFVCGKAEDLPTVEPGDALAVLVGKTVFFAGKFPVMVDQASGSNGIFSGTGTVGVPFLNALSFKVEFKNIRINTDLKMTSGKVSFGREKLVESIEQVTAGITVKPDADGNLSAISSNGLPTIIDAAIVWPGVLPVYDAVTKTVKFTASVDGDIPKEITVKLKDGQPPFVFQDKNEETFAVGLDGKAKYLGKIPMSELLGGKSETSLAINTEKASVQFLAENQKYGLDNYQPAFEENLSYKSNYQALVDQAKGKSRYYVARKSIESHQVDQVQAKITIVDKNILPDKLVFNTGKSEKLSSTLNGDTYTINLIGALADNDKEIYAYHPDAAPGGANIGKLNISAFNKLVKKVVIVPVNGRGSTLSATAIKNALNEIYRQAVVQWDVQVADNFDSGNLVFDQLETANSNVMSAYTKGQKDLVSAYRTDHRIESGTYYIFMVNSLSDGSAGYMVRGGQVGFVSTSAAKNENILHVNIAHELGHGAFMLQHTWTELGIAKGTTNNLMDYAGGTELWSSQWKYMRNADLIFRPFEADDEGARRFPDRELMLRILKKVKETNAKRKSIFYDDISLLNYYDHGTSEDILMEGKKVDVTFVVRRAKNFSSQDYIASYYSNVIKIDSTGMIIYKFSTAKVSDLLSNTYTRGDVVFEFQIENEDRPAFERYLEFDENFSAFRSDEVKGYQLKEEDLVKIFPNATLKMSEVTRLINKYSNQFDINTPKRMAAFLGQIGTETGGFSSLKEGTCYSTTAIKSTFGNVGKTYRKYCDLFNDYDIDDYTNCPNNTLAKCSPKLLKSIDIDDLTVKKKYICNSSLFDYVYGCRMGNGAPTSKDGSIYKGKGFIQLTGKDMYKTVSNAWNKDPTNTIKMEFHGKDINLLVNDLDVAMKASMYYWKIKTNKDGSHANTLADEGNIVELTKLVNGGENGINERKNYYNKALKQL